MAKPQKLVYLKNKTICTFNDTDNYITGFKFCLSLLILIYTPFNKEIMKFHFLINPKYKKNIK